MEQVGGWNCLCMDSECFQDEVSSSLDEREGISIL